MIAFSVFGRPVYRYGIFYGITFLFGYLFLSYIGKRPELAAYPRLQHLLTTQLDTFILVVILGVVLGGRLGHVFLYDRGYYKFHLGEIFQIRQGGMSFIGGVLGVTLVLLGVIWKYRLSLKEFFVLGDVVLCIVPIGIFLGRIGNFLNQELIGKPVNDVPLVIRSLLHDLGFWHVYPQIDQLMRINTNFIQAITEGIIPFVISYFLLRKRLGSKTTTHIPGKIAGWFFIIYACMRFGVEYLKDTPTYKVYWLRNVTQRIMILFFIFGVCLLLFPLQSQKKSLGPLV